MADRYGSRPVLHQSLHHHHHQQQQSIDSTEQIIRNQHCNTAVDNDEDDDDEVVVDEEEEEGEEEENDALDALECDLVKKTDLVELSDEKEEEEEDEEEEGKTIDSHEEDSEMRLLRLNSAGQLGPEQLASEMLANMAARFKNFEEILADLRLQLVEMRSRDGALLRRMAALNEQLSEMHLIEVLAQGSSSGPHHFSSTSTAATTATVSPSHGGEPYGDLHMTDYGGAEAHLSSQLKLAAAAAAAASKRPKVGLPGKGSFHR